MEISEIKFVFGYENIYKVSSCGKIYSNKKEGYKERKLVYNHKGYLTVVLCKEGVCKGYLVHRLVAIAFKENPLNLPQVNHKDGNKENNNISNFRMVYWLL